MAFPSVTLSDWRALVEKELAGKSFDKTLVYEALAGLPVAPLYTEGPLPDPAARGRSSKGWAICMRHGADTSAAALREDVQGGADALWLPLESFAVAEGLEGPWCIVEVKDLSGELEIKKEVQLSVDPMAWRAAGVASHESLADDLRALKTSLSAFKAYAPITVSTLPYHDVGADAVDEIAFALSTGVAYLEALDGVYDAASWITLRTSVGRDTFVELCKLRALRECWVKVLTATGAKPHSPQIHAVCSAPALAVRDPWVNMLRVTTQVFAAVTGGADFVTPNAFDEAFGAASPQGRRVARNTGLVLREESALGRVNDPAGGSYYFESLTDALARKAWARFQELQRSGGIAKALADGSLAKRLDEAWHARVATIAKRKIPVLGVSDFANVGETLPRSAPTAEGKVHRDAAPFEELRLRADAIAPPPEALLVTLGAFAESRPRAGFAATFFASGGIRTRETTTDEKATVACLCGTDERYAEEAAAHAKALKAAGVKAVLLAGRPGALEAQLREAGVDGFLYVGCDAVAVLAEVLTKFEKEPS